MTKVILAWKKALLTQLELGKPLKEAASLVKVGMDRIYQECKADADFDARLKELANRPSTRPSW